MEAFYSDANIDVVRSINHLIYICNDPEELDKRIEQAREFYGDDQINRYFNYRRGKITRSEKKTARWYVNSLLNVHCLNLLKGLVEWFVSKFYSIKKLFGVNADVVIDDMQKKEVNIKLDNILLFFNAYYYENPEALYELGIRYYYGFYPVKQNESLGLLLIGRAAIKGDLYKAKLFLYYYSEYGHRHNKLL